MTGLTSWLAVLASFADAPVTDEPVRANPVVIELTVTDIGGGWSRWDGIGNLNGLKGGRERATSLHVDSENGVYVGTSHGRLLHRKADVWTLEATLDGVQITGIARQEGSLWLSTSEGMAHLQRAKDQQSENPGWIVQ